MAKRKIRYALGAPEDEPKRRTKGPVKYHSTPRNPGGVLGWGDSEDNPLSPHFVPLEQRNEQQKARWWALHGRKKLRPAAGAYDP